ncbi:hypothetical protein CONPUDRAFT_168124 [Coniophora puteana RWD-64-598 SS2]|uniref:Uncharacterized protein n=1 Tax=Coniophora puteana (strain RWD-64-598) TaxID=741705 RepID=A0A5M3MEV2_CONPW|nr:uncharacterized protein CONPUDRAFT_168124 [Coniophora puteana RWD-64-598 SS2]EIW77111.1 hypothetical protein CONPUDRAFT_168124 [Coniophora puteana RWD-64-598 SS2]
MSSQFDTLFVAVSAAVGLAFVIVNPFLTALGVGTVMAHIQGTKSHSNAAKLGEEDLNSSQLCFASEVDNLKAQIEVAEHATSVVATELRELKAHNTALEDEITMLRLAISFQADGFRVALTEANGQADVQAERAELSEQAFRALLSVNEQFGERVEELERKRPEPKGGISKTFSIRGDHAASSVGSLIPPCSTSDICSAHVSPPIATSLSLPIFPSLPVSVSTFTSTIVSPSTSMLAHPLIPTSVSFSSTLIPVASSVHSSTFSAPLVSSIHRTSPFPHGDVDSKFLLSHIYYLDELKTTLESKVQKLEHTSRHLEDALEDQLSSATQLSETVFAMGQETADKDEDIKILKRVIFRQLGEEELEDVEEYIADKKGLQARVGTPHVVLTRPEGGIVCGIDNVSQLTAKCDSFCCPISTSTSYGSTESDYLAADDVSIALEEELSAIYERVLGSWGDAPSQRAFSPESAESPFDKHDLAGAREVAIKEDRLECAMVRDITDMLESLSLSSNDNDDEMESSDEVSSSPSPVSSATPSTTPISTLVSRPTSPITPTATCPADNELYLASANEPRLPNSLSSCLSLVSIASSTSVFGQLIELQTSVVDDVEWLARMVSAF